MKRSIVSTGNTGKPAGGGAPGTSGALPRQARPDIEEHGSPAARGKPERPKTARFSLRPPERGASSGNADPVGVADPAGVANASAGADDFGSASTGKRRNAADDAGTPSAKRRPEDEGVLWVVEGQIFCRTSPGSYPLLAPVPGVKLFKNEVEVDAPVPVCERDAIRAEPQQEHREPSWRLETDDRMMQVTLLVEPGVAIERRLADTEPAAYGAIRLEEWRTTIPIDVSEVRERLKELGVTRGIDEEALRDAGEATDPSAYVVARGVAPAPGSPGSFVPLYDAERRAAAPKTRADGTVDFREKNDLLSVSEGQVLGIIRPPAPGFPGTDLLGRPVPPDDVKEVRIVAGPGAAIMRESRKVVATRAGIPEVETRGQVCKISVLPKLVHPADVDLESGNIHFQGNVDVLGSVQDGMLVQADGSIDVSGNVNMANIRASGSAVVQQNVFGSEVTAGRGGMFFAEAEPLLREAVESIDSLMAAVRQVLQASAFKATDVQRLGLRPLLQVLLQGKYKPLHALLAKLHALIQANAADLDEEWHGFAERTKTYFLFQAVADAPFGLEELERFAGAAEEKLEECRIPSDVPNRIRFQYAHNSRIYCGGDVTVQHGCYNCKLHAEGRLRVDGFLRGGDYYAAGGVVVEEAGARGSGATRIAVPAKASIRVRMVMADTTIQIGARTYKFATDAVNVVARLDKEGKLILH